MSAGQVMVGAPVSFTVMVIVHVASALIPSVAVYVTVVDEPVANEVLVLSAVTVHGEWSAQVAATRVTVAEEAAEPTEMLAGQVMVGEPESATFTVNEQVAGVFKAASVAV